MTATSRAAEEKIGVLLQEDRDTMGHRSRLGGEYAGIGFCDDEAAREGGV